MTPTPAMVQAGAQALRDAQWMLTRRSRDRNDTAARAYLAERVWAAMEAAGIDRTITEPKP